MRPFARQLEQLATRKRNETAYGITSLTTWQANPADVLASTAAIGE
jgi:hypothetical protein